METKTTYATSKVITDPVDPLPCHTCGATIGAIYETPRGYRLYLTGSTMPQYAVHGECPECGEPVHWTGNDEFLRRRVLRGK